MPSLSAADHGATPPVVRVPRDYNAARDLIERNLAAGRVPKVDHIDGAGRYTYAELAERVNRAANALPCWGVSGKSRVMLALLDGIDFPSVFLWAIMAGIVPVVANTPLTTGDCKFMLEESRERALVVSEALLPVFAPILESLPLLEHGVVAGEGLKAKLQQHGKDPLAPCKYPR